mmetsp:Transcript_1739/g.3692  ORF Transcript_1739/g.3692 Transcript_1739/m.3692 type:complete len:113 (-) Transcript_1739:250-588(-)
MVGMHADSATEAIVDAALYFAKPFVVVPCCVFPNLFPHRTVVKAMEHDDDDNNPTQSTEFLSTMTFASVPVRSYEDFCQYLLEKDPRLQCTELPFPGRNLAIWWNGKDKDEP